MTDWTPPRDAPATDRRRRLLLLALLAAALALLFAQKITQLALPGLGVAPKVTIIDPQCPTPGQREVIERDLARYGAGFARGYDNTLYAKNLIAMAQTLGYPGQAGLEEINVVIRFLRLALKLCAGEVP